MHAVLGLGVRWRALCTCCACFLDGCTPRVPEPNTALSADYKALLVSSPCAFSFLVSLMPDHSKVAIFWDYGQFPPSSQQPQLISFLPENCSPPSNSSGLGYDIVNNISCIARLFGSVTTFRAYLDISAQSSKSVLLRSELQSSGVSIIDCPHNGKKDVVDKMVLGMYHNVTLSLVVERSLLKSGYACIRCRSFCPCHNHPGCWRS